MLSLFIILATVLRFKFSLTPVHTTNSVPLKFNCLIDTFNTIKESKPDIYAYFCGENTIFTSIEFRRFREVEKLSVGR